MPTLHTQGTVVNSPTQHYPSTIPSQPRSSRTTRFNPSTNQPPTPPPTATRAAPKPKPYGYVPNRGPPPPHGPPLLTSADHRQSKLHLQPPSTLKSLQHQCCPLAQQPAAHPTPTPLYTRKRKKKKKTCPVRQQLGRAKERHSYVMILCPCLWANRAILTVSTKTGYPAVAVGMQRNR